MQYKYFHFSEVIPTVYWVKNYLYYLELMMTLMETTIEEWTLKQVSFYCCCCNFHCFTNAREMLKHLIVFYDSVKTGHLKSRVMLAFN